MKLYKLAYACAILPIVSVHITLFTAFVFENLHGCNPYWRQCHSISATGRQYPEFFIFKGLMIPIAVLMMGYWFALHRWLGSIQAASISSIGHKWILCLGVIAAMAMIVYTVTLGAVGEPYALARRIGVILFFAFSAFAHLLLLRVLNQRPLLELGLKADYQLLFRFCIGLIVVGCVSAILGFFWEPYQFWDNAFEWWFALLLMGQFFVVGKMWRRTSYTLSLSTN